MEEKLQETDKIISWRENRNYSKIIKKTLFLSIEDYFQIYLGKLKRLCVHIALMECR